MPWRTQICQKQEALQVTHLPILEMLSYLVSCCFFFFLVRLGPLLPSSSESLNCMPSSKSAACRGRKRFNKSPFPWRRAHMWWMYACLNTSFPFFVCKSSYAGALSTQTMCKFACLDAETNHSGPYLFCIGEFPDDFNLLARKSAIRVWKQSQPWECKNWGLRSSMHAKKGKPHFA